MTKSVPANGRDVVEGVGGQHDQVGGRAGLEASEAGPVEQVGGDAGGADLYAIPALLRAGITVACERTGVYGVPAAPGRPSCASRCGRSAHYGLNVPGPHRADGIAGSDDGSRDAAP
ncbi:hypothetical protein AB0L49_39795 [Streptomyces antimycoticus]|uniref:hypothetical protein n=1 Tax=Streptomyces antimycoticus TaxID=68175 RepID=UPI0034444CE5